MIAEKVPCVGLRTFLYGLPDFRRENMLRKGREVHRIYVEVHKGTTFLEDQFTLTEFGRTVLESGGIKAGRAKNVEQIVVARETLYCSGSATCRRVCGGYSECTPDCSKTKVRGHKCNYRVKMTMRLGHVNSWFVEVTGDHSGAFFRYENMLLQKPSARSSQKKMRASLTNPSSFPLISHLTPSQEQNYFLMNATIKSEPPDTTVEELPSPVFQSNPLEFHNSTIDKKPGSQADMSYTCMASNTQVVPDEPSMAVAQSNYTAVMEEMWNDANIDSNENDNDDEKDLVRRVRQLEAHVSQLRNIILKNDKKEDKKKDRKGKVFDFSKYNTRHIALKVAYLGWDYHGFAVQEDNEKTIEAALFEALIKTKLVDSRENSNYHRCGRTDKGVSAFCQVISLDLRTSLLEGPGVKVRQNGTAHERPGDNMTEIKYVHILNKVLPPEIRVLAWAPVDPSFSARFNCKRRNYKYFFPVGNLDVQLMAEASQKLVGEHDFRNFCKLDVANGVVSCKRKILSVDIMVVEQGPNGYEICELCIVGQAFLWHQIRCIIAVLFLIGEGKESPEIIEELLNIEKTPRRPQYNMASELPLVLFDCHFSEEDLDWVIEADCHEENIRHFQKVWAQHAIKAAMVKQMLEGLNSHKVETDTDIAPWCELSEPILAQSEWLTPGCKPRHYKSLLQRQTCESLESKIEHYSKKRKFAENQDSWSGFAGE
ncbi:pseudouridine(38 39) synthase-like [Octopus vulgaris]|uniref:Pseudouridine(38 39) synthase-like n=2 Tax=Octopus TaxID=6643 RepID=A0AA36BWX3_OCTVU|nr:tRNA pseudouridine(38/39) synthase-like [Octopus sinensis]CAI9741177.1 pseudouridine(38 39) synthase-like [Octopus vulgaris]